MNKTRRTITLDSLIIKKLRRIPIKPSNPNSSVNAHTKTTVVELNQHPISSNINEITTQHFLILKLIVITLSSHEGSSLSSVNFRRSNSEHVDINF